MAENSIERLQPPITSAAAQRTASLALLLATVFWGCGFTWAKAGGNAVYRAANLPDGSSFGPVFLLAWRFTVGGIVWLLLFPAARRGWTLPGIMRSIGVGILLALGLILQHIGLDLTSEAVSAFLTSLTILFVPLLLTFAMRKPPRPLLWVGVALATLGIWLMTGATPSGFGKGELLGLACAVAFSAYILSVNAAAVHDTPWRMTAGQFVMVGMICFVFCAFVPGGARNFRPGATAHILAQRDVWLNVLLLAAFPTIAAFGLLTRFQPRIDPTRAALLYLIEPVVATSYAAIVAHHLIDHRATAGAA